jgi:hypothetical protein
MSASTHLSMLSRAHAQAIYLAQVQQVKTSSFVRELLQTFHSLSVLQFTFSI